MNVPFCKHQLVPKQVCPAYPSLCTLNTCQNNMISFTSTPVFIDWLQIEWLSYIHKGLTSARNNVEGLVLFAPHHNFSLVYPSILHNQSIRESKVCEDLLGWIGDEEMRVTGVREGLLADFPCVGDGGGVAVTKFWCFSNIDSSTPNEIHENIL